MTSISRPIVFFGTEDFSAISLAQLLEHGFPVRLVITKPDSRRGRGKQLCQPAVKQLALTHDIPVLQPAKLRDIIPDIQALGQPVGVLVSFGKIIPQVVIDCFSPGIINLHPSLLPRYRGPSPIESAIANRDTATGVSIMQLSAAMDAGPVYAQLTHPLRGDEQQLELYNTLGQLGSKALVQLLPRIVSGSLQPTPQDEFTASYCQLLTKASGIINPAQHTAAEAEAMVRAYHHYPRARLQLGERQYIITQAHTARAPVTTLDPRCSDDTYLVIDQLIAPSGKELSAAAFLRGYRV